MPATLFSRKGEENGKGKNLSLRGAWQRSTGLLLRIAGTA